MNSKAMNLLFSIEYVTQPGYWLQIRFTPSGEVLRMQSSNGRIWQAQLFLEPGQATKLKYSYEVATVERIMDAETPHHFHSWSRRKYFSSVRIVDRWHTSDDSNFLWTSAFADTVFNCGKKIFANKQADLLLKLDKAIVSSDKRIFVTGNQPGLGNWNPLEGMELTRLSDYCFEVGLDSKSLAFPVEYKFVVVDRLSRAIEWEEGANRNISVVPATDETVLEQSPLRLPWDKVRLAGIVIPLFSLRSRHSWGVGDFGDLRRMVDWASSVDLHILQLLPLNDTTRTGDWQDSYPYSAISAYALHPMFLDVNRLGSLKDENANRDFEARRGAVNRLPQMDYVAANNLKREWYSAFFGEQGRDIQAGKEYKEFEKRNRMWLKPYCFFCVLQEENHTSDFRLWGPFSKYDEKKLETYLKAHRLQQRYAWHAVLQFLLDKQLREVHFYANSKALALKGDLPIGISRDSATAWVNPRYFNFDGQAGAPPDFFTTKGQNWGFPTYNWDNLLLDGGKWWQDRLGKMAEYFDAFRIDHILGFFRIWEIPTTNIYGTLGHFSPALPYNPEELQRAGFQKVDETMLEAVFTGQELAEHFGAAALPLVRNFLRKDSAGIWHYRAAVNNQRKLWTCLQSEKTDAALADKLMEGLCNILFICDARQPELLHPNVWAHSTPAYCRLEKSMRQAYDRIFDDFFNHRNNELWMRQSLKRLPCVVQSSRMLACAEDLGMVPSCVPGILAKFRILTLEVPSMPKRAEGQFSRVENNPFLSVDTITTHDMEPLRLWWKRNRKAVQVFWEERMNGEGPAPADLSGAMVEQIIRKHLDSPSLLSIISLQDWLGMDEKLRNPNVEEEQVNCPADASHYWRYRMHLFIEDLQTASDWNDKIRNLIHLSNRR